MTVIGPIVETSVNGTMGFTTKHRYRQLPIDHANPLPYSLDKGYSLAGSGGFYANGTSWSSNALPVDLYNAAHKKAYDRFKDQVQEEAQLSVDILQRKQAYDHLLSTTEKLFNFTVGILTRNPKKCARALGLQKQPGRLPKALAGTAGEFLAYSYGWIPLVQDIGTSVEVLQKPYPEGTVRGRATAKDQQRIFNPGVYWYEKLIDRRLSVELGAVVEVTNHTAWKANQLGFVNPLTVAWEMVPFSFVVDWFVPIGDFLGSLTDFVGLNLKNSYTTQYGTRYEHGTGYTAYYKGGKYRIQCKRVLGVSAPVLRPRFTGFYSMRGANAIAMLLSGLRNIKP